MRSLARSWAVLVGLALLGCGAPAPSRSPRAPRSNGNTVHVVNPNEFTVEVELRSGGACRTFSVPAQGDAEALVSDGRFEIFFVYANEPAARYAGDPFALDHQGIEIHVVKAESRSDRRR